MAYRRALLYFIFQSILLGFFFSLSPPLGQGVAQLSTHLREQRKIKVTGRQSQSTICANKILMMAGSVAGVAKNGEKGREQGQKNVKDRVCSGVLFTSFQPGLYRQ